MPIAGKVMEHGHRSRISWSSQAPHLLGRCTEAWKRQWVWWRVEVYPAFTFSPS